MRKMFFEYNAPCLETIKKLWDSASFVFDANVLLNLYRYSNETSQKFLDVIIKLENRVWLPYQVGLEFNKNRLIVISDQKKHYEDFEKKINDIVGEIENKNRNPYLSSAIFNRLISLKDDITQEVTHKIKLFDESLTKDLLLEKINSAFEDKVGTVLNDSEVSKLISDGEKRYKDKIPPGYCDIKKPEKERFGDLIIWREIMCRAKKDKIDIIFILDDRKEDWWLEHQGKTISPRPELLSEFKKETNQICHFYKPFQFLEYSNEYLGSDVKQEVIQEVRNYTYTEPNNTNFIQINLVLKGKTSDLNLLVNDLKTAGYNIYIESSNVDDNHDVCIILPNIPDLERRLNSKYMSNLSDYNIHLIRRDKL